MPSISKGNRPMTVINVFTVAPDRHMRLVDLLTRATESSVRHVPGFVAAALHRSLDGTKVTMYAQWRSPEDYEQMRSRSDKASLRNHCGRLDHRARFNGGGIVDQNSVPVSKTRCAERGDQAFEDGRELRGYLPR